MFIAGDQTNYFSPEKAKIASNLIFFMIAEIARIASCAPILEIKIIA
jgi:hypothetical protein